MRTRRMIDSPGQLTLEKLTGELDPNIISRCPKCGHKLRSPKSRARGIGPVCAKPKPRKDNHAHTATH